MIIEYLQMAFTENPSSNNPSQQPIKREVIVPEKFRTDIEALERCGMQLLNSGLSVINITLAELLKIVPRNRRRIDSYNSLVEFLKETYGIELKITSNKTKM